MDLGPNARHRVRTPRMAFLFTLIEQKIRKKMGPPDPNRERVVGSREISSRLSSPTNHEKFVHTWTIVNIDGMNRTGEEANTTM